MEAAYKKDRQMSLSERLSKTLDYLGYNKEMVKYRRETFRELNEIYHQEHEKYQNCSIGKVVGSKGEGLTKTCESDTDTICLHPWSVCVELTPDTEYTFPDSTDIFAVQYTRPGYCVLALISPSTKYYGHALFEKNGYSYLSSSGVKSRVISTVGVTNENVISRKLCGPSLSSTSIYKQDNDWVPTIRCMCPNILHAWMIRPRENDWPPMKVRDKISKMEGNVVPKASENSEPQNLEWRFCFNEIEIKLIEALNDTQTKLLKLLKLIKSDYLSDRGYQVTSYMMKNVVFWLAEKYPQSMFRADTTFPWLIKALRFLKRALKHNQLSYYMIPDRNLLQEKNLSAKERSSLVGEINMLLKSGQKLLFKVNKILSVMFLSSQELLAYQIRCSEIEIVESRLRIFSSKCTSLRGMTIKDTCKEEEYQQLVKYIIYLIDEHDWPVNIQAELSKCGSCWSCVRVILR